MKPVDELVNRALQAGDLPSLRSVGCSPLNAKVVRLSRADRVEGGLDVSRGE